MKEVRKNSDLFLFKTDDIVSKYRLIFGSRYSFKIQITTYPSSSLELEIDFEYSKFRT